MSGDKISVSMARLQLFR